MTPPPPPCLEFRGNGLTDRLNRANPIQEAPQSGHDDDLSCEAATVQQAQPRGAQKPRCSRADPSIKYITGGGQTNTCRILNTLLITGTVTARPLHANSRAPSTDRVFGGAMSSVTWPGNQIIICTLRSIVEAEP